MERHVLATAQLEGRLFLGIAPVFVVLGGGGLRHPDELVFVSLGALCSVLGPHSAVDIFVCQWVHPGRESQ